ncbi:uncharacterized protein LOC118555808 [Halichoerus grypus]
MSGAGQRPGRLGPSGLVQSRLGKRLRYLLLGSPRPQMQGSRLPPGEGSPGHRSRRCPPSFPPSLPLSRPPSLSPSLARCRSRGPPAGNLFWTKSRYLRKREREKERTSYVGKKERKTLNRVYFPRSDHWPASVQTPRTRPCSGRGVRGLLPRPRGPPRPAHCALHTRGRRPPAAQTPHRPQGPSYRLNIRLPASRLASAPEPALLRLRPKSTHNPPCPSPRAGSDTPPSQGARRASLGPRPCPGLQTPSPARDPHKAQCPPAAPSPPPLLPFTCSRERLYLRAEARPWARAEGAGEPGSRGAGEATEDRPG